MDSAELAKEIAAASEGIKELTKSEDVLATAKTMPRCFCVLVVDEKYTPKTGKTIVKYENYRVLVGSQDNIDKMSGFIKEKVTGTFKVVDRHQAM